MPLVTPRIAVPDQAAQTFSANGSFNLDGAQTTQSGATTTILAPVMLSAPYSLQNADGQIIAGMLVEGAQSDAAFADGFYLLRLQTTGDKPVVQILLKNAVVKELSCALIPTSGVFPKPEILSAPPSQGVSPRLGRGEWFLLGVALGMAIALL